MREQKTVTTKSGAGRSSGTTVREELDLSLIPWLKKKKKRKNKKSKRKKKKKKK